MMFQPENQKCINPKCNGKPAEDSSTISKWFECSRCGISSAWGMGWSGAAAKWDELYKMCNPTEGAKPTSATQPAGWTINDPEAVGKPVADGVGCDCWMARDKDGNQVQEQCEYCAPNQCEGNGVRDDCPTDCECRTKAAEIAMKHTDGEEIPF